ncbi:MAG: class II aldolase [Granulosicoccus sp.]|nr:class II aldolase [Granulosicoccus sp.]
MTLQRLPDEQLADMAELIRVSAMLGADPMLVQSAGGNTSIKQNDRMWIKASGTLLEEAQDKDIFVPVDLPPLRRCIAQGDPQADQPQAFLSDAAYTLRPSIETSLHAIFEQRVVLHVHCIHTLAHAIRTDALESISHRLEGLDWVIVPYTKPGANLAKTVSKSLRMNTNIVILANHGLLVAGDSVEQALSRVLEVHERLAIDPAAKRTPDVKALAQLAEGTAYELPEHAPVHQLALEPHRVQQASSGSLYPDHVIFCGVAVTVLEPGDDLNSIEHRCAEVDCRAPVFVLVPGAGVLVRRDASKGTRALIRCLADVLVRVPAEAPLNYLSDAQNSELLNWDAEQYRQALNAR